MQGVNCLDILVQIQKVLDIMTIRHYRIRPCGHTSELQGHFSYLNTPWSQCVWISAFLYTVYKIVTMTFTVQVSYSCVY